MKSLLNKLEQGITTIENGTISSAEMDEMVQTARETYERLLIIRYKLYEQQVFPERIHSPIDLVLQTLDNQQNEEIETPIDFNLEEPEEFSQEDIEITPEEPIAIEEQHSSDQEYSPNPRELFIESVVEKPIEQEDVVNEFDDLLQKENTSEPIIEEEKVEIEVSTLNFVNEEVSVEPLTEVSAKETHDLEEDAILPETANLTAKELEFKTLENRIASNYSIEKVDTLIGSFTLNDKLLFINSLFDGSSDTFAKAIKTLDTTLNMFEARKLLVDFSDEFHWEMDNEVVEDFVQRICQRHAETLGN